MALDKGKIQERLNALQSRGGNKTFEKVDYTKIYWKPRLGDQTIRLVPSKFNKDWPFQQVQFHKDITVNSMYALSNWGEKDPILEFITEIKGIAATKKTAGENSDDEWDLAKKLRPKSRMFAQVIVRGEEHLGTRLWEFGSEVEEQLLNILNNPEYGDVTDINEGTDLSVMGINAEYQGRKYVKPSITPKRLSTPLTEDKTLLQNLLEKQNDPLGLYKKYTFAEILSNLEKWLEPEAETVTEQSVEPEVSVQEDIDTPPWKEEDVPEVVVPVEAPITAKKTVKKMSDKKPLVKEEVAAPVVKKVTTPPAKTEQVTTTVTATAAAKSNKDKFNKLFGK